MSNTASSAGSKPIVLAYSGGLDTSFLVPWVAENYGRPVITVTVDTGGIDAATARTLGERARALGAVEHHQVDARADYFEQVLRFLIMGNVKRGQLYPLCVGAERVMQAQTIAHMARKLGTNSIAHGCTAAGNDQVRFEVALRTLAPELEVLAPVRAQAFKPSDELQNLQGRGLPVGREPPPPPAASRRRPWSSRGTHFFVRASLPGTRSPSSMGGPAHSMGNDSGRSPSSKLSRNSRAPTASAARSISGIPSSVPKAASHLRRRPRKRCSSHTVNSRSSC